MYKSKKTPDNVLIVHTFSSQSNIMSHSVPSSTLFTFHWSGIIFDTILTLHVCWIECLFFGIWHALRFENHHISHHHQRKTTQKAFLHIRRHDGPFWYKGGYLRYRRAWGHIREHRVILLTLWFGKIWYIICGNSWQKLPQKWEDSAASLWLVQLAIPGAPFPNWRAGRPRPIWWWEPFEAEVEQEAWEVGDQLGILGWWRRVGLLWCFETKGHVRDFIHERFF